MINTTHYTRRKVRTLALESAADVSDPERCRNDAMTPTLTFAFGNPLNGSLTGHLEKNKKKPATVGYLSFNSS